MEERLKKSRKTTREPLSRYIFALVGLYVQCKDKELKKILATNCDYILNDCEKYQDMPNEKELDALGELSDLACLFVFEDEYHDIYYRINEMIKSYLL